MAFSDLEQVRSSVCLHTRHADATRGNPRRRRDTPYIDPRIGESIGELAGVPPNDSFGRAEAGRDLAFLVPPSLFPTYSLHKSE